MRGLFFILVMIVAKAICADDDISSFRTMAIKERTTQYVLQKRDDPRQPTERNALLRGGLDIIYYREGAKLVMEAENPKECEIVKVEKETGKVFICDSSNRTNRMVLPLGIQTNTYALVVNVRNRNIYNLRKGQIFNDGWKVIEMSSVNGVSISNVSYGTTNIPFLSEREKAIKQKENKKIGASHGE